MTVPGDRATARRTLLKRAFWEDPNGLVAAVDSAERRRNADYADRYRKAFGAGPDWGSAVPGSKAFAKMEEDDLQAQLTHPLTREALARKYQLSRNAMRVRNYVNDPANAYQAKVLPSLRQVPTLSGKIFTPANMTAGAAGLAGGALLGSAFDSGKPLYSRIIRTLLGAGALYGGYKLFSDPRVSAYVNAYGGRALSAIKSFGGDFIRNAMTPGSGSQPVT